MKKIGKLILLSLLVLPIFSCASKDEDLISVKRIYNIESKVDISFEELESKFNNKEDFILYIYDESCEACNNFEPILNAYIKNNKTLIYSLDSMLINTSNSFLPYSYTPTIGLINNGEVKYKIDGVSEENIFSSYSSFDSYLKDKIALSNEIEVTKDTYASLLNSEEEYIILYYWSKCSDCSYMFNNFFNDYIKQNPSITYYGFELSYYYANRKDQNDSFWTSFTKEVGLSLDGSSLGYKNGVVPTFQHRKNKQILDQVIIFNDDYSKISNDNGEIESISITSSYYQDSPYIGKTYVRSENKSAISQYHEDTSTFYFNKIKDIFNKMK